MKIFRIRITSPTLSRWLLLLTSKAAISVPSKTAPPRIASPIPAPIKNPPKTAVNNLSGVTSGKRTNAKHTERPADVPVVQLSIDETQPPRFHYEIAERLSSLRDEDVLIVGSGNLVHNLHTYAWGRHNVEPFEWAIRFEERVRGLLLEGNHEPLITYESLGKDAMLSAPTPDHYLPMLYVLAVRKEDDEVSFPVEGFDGGSVSMLSVVVTE